MEKSFVEIEITFVAMAKWKVSDDNYSNDEVANKRYS